MIKMGEKAKITVNEPIAIAIIKKDDLDLDKFYSADLKIFVKAATKEIKRLESINQQLIKENEVLKAMIPSNQNYTYGIR